MLESMKRASFKILTRASGLPGYNLGNPHPLWWMSRVWPKAILAWNVTSYWDPVEETVYLVGATEQPFQNQRIDKTRKKKKFRAKWKKKNEGFIKSDIRHSQSKLGPRRDRDGIVELPLKVTSDETMKQ